MDDYSMPESGGDAGSLPYLAEAVAGAAAAAIEEIVNATDDWISGNGSDFLKAALNTTARAQGAYRDTIPWWLALLFLTLATAIIIVGIAGNAFVVAVIFTDRKLLHSSVNLFLLNLALADMGNLIFVTPDALMTILDSPWVLPSVLCPLLHFLQEYFLFASVLLQMSIGIERFMAICSPLQMQRFSRRTTVFFLLCAWMFAALFALPDGIWSKTSPHPINPNGPDFCYSMLPKLVKSVVHGVLFVVMYCIPLVLLSVLYFIMCRRLWGKECMIAGETQQMAILRLRRSVVKMLVISMLIYFCCYTPIQSLSFLHMKMPLWLRIVFNMLVLVSSAANPIVYIMCCRHFHQRFVSMVTRTIHCCPRTPEKYQTVIADADKYARMSVVTHSHSSRRHRKVKQRERSADVSLSVRLLPQIDSSAEVDARGDAAVGGGVSSSALGRRLRVARRVAAPHAVADSPPPPSLTPPHPRGARASTVSATSFHWGSRDSAKFRPFRCTNPHKKSTEMITVD